MTGIQNAPRFDHHQFRFALRSGPVLDAAGHNIEFPGVHMHAAIRQVDTQGAFQHQECFVGLRVRVPDEFAFDAHDLELVIVHLGNDPGAPLLFDKRCLVDQVHWQGGMWVTGFRHDSSSESGVVSLSLRASPVLVRSCKPVLTGCAGACGFSA
ncbi:hypothetical protein D3C75_1003490 [compost metagenome]